MRTIDPRSSDTSRRTGVLGLGALALFLGVGGTATAAAPNASAFSHPGVWDYYGEAPVYAVHAVVLHTGKVLMWAGTAEAGLPLNSAVWDPIADTYTFQAFSDDLFCAHQVVLGDGRVLVHGGAHDPGHGIPSTWIFDPTNESWTKKADMNNARWYPTTLAAPRGVGAITFSGRDDNLRVIEIVEDYNVANNVWTERPPSADRLMSIYPSMHMMPNGTVFYSGARWDGSSGRWSGAPPTALFDLQSNTWADTGVLNERDRTEGFALTLPPDNDVVMMIGGRGEDPSLVSTDTVEMIDLASPNPTWQYVSSMKNRRRNVNAVVLPDGHVLVTTGITGFKWDTDPKPVYEAEEYDPATDTWTTRASMTIQRQYHSAAILLPDGRVANLGGVQAAFPFLQKHVEVYSPSYLFRGPRPEITNAPAGVVHGQSFVVSTTQADRIESVVFMKPGATTHHTDTEQRMIPLDFSQTGPDELTVVAPGGPLPWYSSVRGYYMLMVLNDLGVPSVAEFVHLGD